MARVQRGDKRDELSYKLFPVLLERWSVIMLLTYFIKINPNKNN